MMDLATTAPHHLFGVHHDLGWANIDFVFDNFCTCEFAFIARNRAAGKKHQNGERLRCFLVKATASANVNRDQIPAIGGIQWSVGVANTDLANPQAWAMAIDRGHADDKVQSAGNLWVEDLREFDDFSIKTDDLTHNGEKFRVQLSWGELDAFVLEQANIGREGGLFTIHRLPRPRES
jgi:hypothetical protein